jgi:hypothetical protein
MATLLETIAPQNLLPPIANLSVFGPTSYKRDLARNDHDERMGNYHTTEVQLPHTLRMEIGNLSLDRQPWMEVIGSSWKFKLTRDKFSSIIKYKARLVAR